MVRTGAHRPGRCKTPFTIFFPIGSNLPPPSTSMLDLYAGARDRTLSTKTLHFTDGFERSTSKNWNSRLITEAVWSEASSITFFLFMFCRLPRWMILKHAYHPALDKKKKTKKEKTRQIFWFPLSFSIQSLRIVLATYIMHYSRPDLPLFDRDRRKQSVHVNCQIEWHIIASSSVHIYISCLKETPLCF